LFQFRIWQIALATLLVALACAFGPQFFYTKKDLFFCGTVFLCGGAVRIVGWRLGSAFTLLGRHASAWLFSVIGCTILVFLLRFALEPKPIDKFLDEYLPFGIISGIILGSFLEMVFLVFSLLSRFVFDGPK